MIILSAGMERSSGQQFGYIVLAIVCTLGISIITGLITGNLKLTNRDALHHHGYVLTLSSKLICFPENNPKTIFPTGVLMNQPCCPTVAHKDMLIDHDFWDIHDLGSDPR